MTRMGIAERKAELGREIARGENAIARKKRRMAELDKLPDLGELRDGTVIATAVTIARSPDAYTFIGFKTGDKWYVTGKQSPNGVSSDEFLDWLTSGVRNLVWIAVVGVVGTVEVAAVDLGPALDRLLAGVPMGHASSYPGNESVPGRDGFDGRPSDDYYLGGGH